MAEKLEYTSKYDGKTSDAIMDYSNKLRQQTSATDADTVQVFDTSGNPHKISKTELLKKSALALPSLNDISAFVAVNQAGNAIGLMTKQQVATVLGELIGIASPSKDGLMSKNGFLARGRADINTDANMLITTGIYAVYCYGQDYASKHYPIELGHIIVFVDNVGGSKSQLAISSTGQMYARMSWGEYNWSEWRAFKI